MNTLTTQLRRYEQTDPDTADVGKPVPNREAKPVGCHEKFHHILGARTTLAAYHAKIAATAMTAMTISAPLMLPPGDVGRTPRQERIRMRDGLRDKRGIARISAD